jgi:hypothetical protein
LINLPDGGVREDGGIGLMAELAKWRNCREGGFCEKAEFSTRNLKKRGICKIAVSDDMAEFAR